MLFNSLQFIFFFPAVVAIYFICSPKWRWVILLIASAIFYMAFIPKYLLILLYLIAIDFIMGRLIEKAEGKKRKIFFIISLIANLGTLFVFKYYNFFSLNLNALAQFLNWHYNIKTLSLILPLGLSFHTFQSLSYVIEVYRGKYKAERHLGIYALYVLFFPQLVAGPIERPYNLLPQLRLEHKFELNRVWQGLQQMAWGFFKKLVIADRLGGFVDQVFNNLRANSGLTLIIGIVFYAFQIYCDFSGYSNIALGSAKVMGFNLMTNFNRPFFSKSINDFWRRWHISLTGWFRDYLFYPLAYIGRSKTWLYLYLLITFLTSGLWHGAGWTFIIWGGLHGVYLISGLATKRLRQKIVNVTKLNRLPKIHSLIQILYVFTLACISWVFFRAASVKDAGYYLINIFSGWRDILQNLSNSDFVQSKIFMNFRPAEFLIAMLAIIFLIIVEYIQEKYGSISALLLRRSIFIQALASWLLLLSIIVFGIFTSKGFIYFQF